MEMSSRGDRSATGSSRIRPANHNEYVIQSPQQGAISTISGSAVPDNRNDQAVELESIKHQDSFRNDTENWVQNSNEEEAANRHPKTSVINTFVNFMKGTIGTGVLAMPDAVKNGGLIVASIGIVILGILTAYCGHLLLHAYVQVSGGGKVGMSFSQVAYTAFHRVGSRVRRFATAAKYAINIFITIAQLGTCCIYIIVVSRMVKEVLEFSFPSLHWDIRIYESLLLIVLIPSCFVTTLKFLSYVTLVANVFEASGLILTLQYVFRNLGPVENLNYVPPSLSSGALFFGTAMFDLCVATFILPMERDMANRAAFHGWDGLLSLGMSCVTIIYVVVGFYGYLAFGSEARMILTNLPSDDWLYNAVRLIIAAAIFLTYNLQLYFPVDILYPSLKRRINKPWFDRFGEYIFRTVLVLFTYSLAVSIPCIELMISLVGALALGSLNLVAPPLIELVCCFHHNGKRSRFTYVKCGVMIAFGAFGCIIGSVSALQAIAAALASPKACGK